MTELPLTERLTELRPLLAAAGPPVYLVGGAVRDALLGRVSHDLDFAVPSHAVDLARSVAGALGGAFYLLDAERGTARVILDEAELDFALFRGSSLLADLQSRDFTINAMALPVGSSDVDAIIDPVGGQSDLAARLIRATGPTAIYDDPVRGLRAIRLAAQLDFQLLAETRDMVCAASGRLRAVSAERVRDELCRLLTAPLASGSIRLMDELGLLPHVLPELDATKEVHEPQNLFDHTLLTLQKMEALLEMMASPTGPLASAAGEFAVAREMLTPYASQLAEYLGRSTAGGRTGRFVLFLGVLLHGAGKPGARSVGQDGQIHFPGHERIAASLASRRARELALSTGEVRQVTTLVRHHTQPTRLSRLGPAAEPSRRSVYRFYRDVGQTGLDICLLCLADGLAQVSSRPRPPEPLGWERRVRAVGTLLDQFFNHYRETVAPIPLLDGRVLMSALGIRPGPEVGRLLQAIEEAQAVGLVSTREGALALARQQHQRVDSPEIDGARLG